MFCKNCGSEIPAGAKVCGQCGTPVDPVPTAQAPSPQAPAAQDGKVKILYIALAAIHVLQLILWFCPFLYAEASIFGYAAKEAASIAQLCSEEETAFFTPIFIVLFIAAALLALLPLIRTGKPRRHRMIFSQIVSILAVLLILLLRYAVDDYAGYGIDVGFTFGGWVYLLISIGTLVVAGFISSWTKRAKT